jgi:itaconate CoA-transferase
MRPLDGITVISLEQAVAAPFATRQLADLGARVIKIERPGSGDPARHYDGTVLGQCSYFVWLNRSKESLTLDVKAPEGRRVLDELLADADVFVQNLAPGAAGRLGLDATTLASRYPKLVVCSINGYGSAGSWAGRKAYDLLIQGETGLVSLTGTPREMVKVGISVADIAAGMYAFSGILTALYQRATTGTAPAVEVALFDALAEWMGQPAYYTRYGGRQPARVGAQHATIAPYGPFPTADGGTVVLAIQNDREWTSFCAAVLERPEVATDARFATVQARVANREVLNELITRRVTQLDTGDVITLLEGANIAYSRLNSVAEFLEHPALMERDRWHKVDTPAGPIAALPPPAALGGVPPRMDPVPALGQHTEAVLRELGRADDQIRALRAAGVV